MIQALAPISNARMNIGIDGTGGTAEAVGNVLTTFTAASEGRITGTLSQPTTTTDRLVWTQTYAGTKTITECGRCNNLTGTTVGTHVLLCRALFTGIPVVLNDQIQFTFDHTQ